MPRKVCVAVTARPSYSRIKSALSAIEANPDLELQLVVAASALLDRYGETVKYGSSGKWGGQVARSSWMKFQVVHVSEAIGSSFEDLNLVVESFEGAG